MAHRDEAADMFEEASNIAKEARTQYSAALQKEKYGAMQNEKDENDDNGKGGGITLTPRAYTQGWP